MNDNKRNYLCKLKDCSYGIYPAPLRAQEAINILGDYLLGEDWYVIDPIGTEQINTIMVHEILFKYSPEYRRDRRIDSGKPNLLDKFIVKWKAFKDR